MARVSHSLSLLKVDFYDNNAHAPIPEALIEPMGPANAREILKNNSDSICLFRTFQIVTRSNSSSGPVKISHEKMAARDGCIDFMFLDPPYPTA